MIIITSPFKLVGSMLFIFGIGVVIGVTVRPVVERATA